VIPLAVLGVAGSLFLIRDRGADFLMFYQSAAAWLAGRSPYGGNPLTPNLTPPVLLPLFGLFARMSFPVARFAWSVLSLLALVWSVSKIGHHVGVPPWQVAAIVLASSPGMLGLGLGQVSFLLLAMMTAAWNASHRRREVEAGAWLGLLCVIKPFYGLFGLWMIWRRQWRAVVSCGALFLVGLLAGIVVAGPHVTLEWLARVREATWYSRSYNIGIAGVGARLFSRPGDPTVSWTPLLVSPALAISTDFALGAMTMWIAWRTLRKRPGDVDTAYAVLGLSGLLLAPLAWIHYLPVSTGPVLAASRRAPAWSLWVAGAAALLPYPFVNRHQFGAAATVMVGQWAFAVTFWLLVIVQASCARTSGAPDRPGAPADSAACG
jgi:hypothetical protein